MASIGFRGETVNILKGPFDPGGQPVLESPHRLLLGLFAWNLTSGATISKAVLKDPAQCQDFWRWDIAQVLVREADELGFEFEVPFGRWLGHGGPTRFNEDSLDFLSTAAALTRVGEVFYRRVALGLSGTPLIGSAETIAEQLRAISGEGGQRGCLLSFFDPFEGLRFMRERVLPILRRMGLRQ